MVRRFGLTFICFLRSSLLWEPAPLRLYNENFLHCTSDTSVWDHEAGSDMRSPITNWGSAMLQKKGYYICTATNVMLCLSNHLSIQLSYYQWRFALFYHDNGRKSLLRNISEYLQKCTVSLDRKPQSSLTFSFLISVITTWPLREFVSWEYQRCVS